MNRARTWALLGLALAGCGWHAGLALPEMAKDARSVGVEAVRRDPGVLQRDLEPRLTDALSEAVVDWVDLPLVAPAEADLVLRAELLEYRRRGGVRNRQNQLVETAVFVRARAQLYDHGGNKVGEPALAQEWSGYALDEPQRNEDAARDRALRHVAQTLVLDLFEPRGKRSESPR